MNQQIANNYSKMLKKVKVKHRYRAHSISSDGAHSKIDGDGIFIELNDGKGLFINLHEIKNNTGISVWGHPSFQSKGKNIESSRLLIKPAAANVIYISTVS